MLASVVALATERGDSFQPDYNALLTIPELWISSAEDVDEEVVLTLEKGLALALEDWNESRETEGAALGHDLLARVLRLEQWTDILRERAPAIKEERAENLRERITEEVASLSLGELAETRFLQEAGTDAVKIEGGVTHAHIIRALTGNGIPVMAHIGMQPQSVKANGYAVRGRKDSDTAQLFADLDAVVQAGAFAVTLECVMPDLAVELTKRSPVPTIGIGAGNGCDGQFLVLADLLGLGDGPLPKFAKAYANLGEQATDAVQRYAGDVRSRAFPDAEHTY